VSSIFWVLADAKSGYTYNFDVCLSKAKTSTFGLSYRVVMDVIAMLFHQGYRLLIF
jgi:hypothetical protein